MVNNNFDSFKDTEAFTGSALVRQHPEAAKSGPQCMAAIQSVLMDFITEKTAGATVVLMVGSNRQDAATDQFNNDKNRNGSESRSLGHAPCIYATTSQPPYRA